MFKKLLVGLGRLAVSGAVGLAFYSVATLHRLPRPDRVALNGAATISLASALVAPFFRARKYPARHSGAANTN